MLMKYKDFKMLSNDDMKQITGGFAGSGQLGCNVSCASGYFACCNSKPVETCFCAKNGDDKTCESGGSGSTSCSLT